MVYSNEGPLVHIPLHQTMATIFESIALDERFKNRLAVIFEEKELSYHELNRRANQIANLIQKRVQMSPDTIIALCLERSELMIIGILGIWKAGGAYVALDPKYPPERINFILEDTKAVLILTERDTNEKMESHLQNDSLSLMNITSSQLTPSNSDDFNQPMSLGTTSDHLSHILYTSGTTGRPKGVMVIHKALINESIDYPRRYKLQTGPESSEVVVHFLNYVFNAATVPVVLALSHGYTLLIVRPSLLFQTQKLYAYLAEHHVTHIDTTPSLLNQLDLSRIPSLRRVAPGGEVLTTEVFNVAMSSAPQMSFFNIYGNSEGTLCVMYTDVRPDNFTKAFQNVATNKKCYVLDETNLELATVGTVGELGISGAGLARGYLNNEKLTCEQFISNPFQTVIEKEEGRHEILYKTGDLVRQLIDGSVEFVGRKDLQIKIRGYRVELGEIESVIESYPGISASVVIPKNVEKSEEMVLRAYFVLKGDVIDVEKYQDDLLSHVRQYLPDYMVPTYWVQLSEIPLTQNGKIDRNALPSSSPISPLPKTRKEDGINNLLPGDCQLNFLVNIWREILNLPEDENQGIDYDFFDAGGNSLLAIRLAERVNVAFGTSIDAVHVFNYSTIAEFKFNLQLPVPS